MLGRSVLLLGTAPPKKNPKKTPKAKNNNNKKPSRRFKSHWKVMNDIWDIHVFSGKHLRESWYAFQYEVQEKFIKWQNSLTSTKQCSLWIYKLINLKDSSKL